MGPLDKIRLFRALCSTERRLLFRAGTMLPRVDVSLRLRGWERTRTQWEQWADGMGPRHGIEPRRVAWLVERAARTVPWPATCLRRSLVLWALLRRDGVHAEIRLGVRKAGGSHAAHAWVECQGVVLNDRQDVAQTFPAAFDAQGRDAARVVRA